MAAAVAGLLRVRARRADPAAGLPVAIVVDDQRALVAVGKDVCGFVARLHPALEIELKIRQQAFVFEISLDDLFKTPRHGRRFTPPARFPRVERDLSVLVPERLPADRIVQAVRSLGRPLLENTAVIDEYVGGKVPSGYRSLSISLVFSAERTLEDREIEAAVGKVLQGLEKNLGVRLREA